MARYDFGGTLADFVVTSHRLGTLDTLALSAATLTMWSAQSGGTRYTDLVLNGSAVTSISVGTDGQVPKFQGPDGITEVWADGGAGRVRIATLQGTPGPAGAASTVPGPPGPAFPADQMASLSATYAPLAGIRVTTAATGTSNCSTALQADLNAAAAAGQSLFMPKGIYTLGAGITIPSNTHWFGERGTVIKVGSAFPTSHPMVNGASQLVNVHIHDLEIDGNAAGQSGDQTVNGTPNELMFLSSAAGTPGNNIVLERIYAHDSYRLGFVLQNIDGAAIRDCRVANNGRDGISLFDACNRVIISRNRVSGCNDDHIALDGQAAQMSNIVVVENVLTGPGARGLGKGVRVQGVRNAVVQGNTIDKMSEDGIRVNDYGAAGVQQVTISENVISSAGTGGTGSRVGIIVMAGFANYPAARSVFSGVADVVISNNTITAAGGNGIELRSDHAVDELKRVKVRGNIVSSCAGEGISFTGSFAVCDTDIDGNTVYDNAGHGIFANLGLRARVCGNTAYNNGTAGVNTTGVRIVSADVVVATQNLCYETRLTTARTQTIGFYINATGATSVLVKDNVTSGMATGWSHNNIPGLSALEGAFGKVPVLKQTVTGAKGSNAALASLLTALSNIGYITDSSSA